MYTVLSDLLVKQDGPSYERLSLYMPFRLRRDTGFVTYYFYFYFFGSDPTFIMRMHNCEPRDR